MFDSCDVSEPLSNYICKCLSVSVNFFGKSGDRLDVHTIDPVNFLLIGWEFAEESDLYPLLRPLLLRSPGTRP